MTDCTQILHASAVSIGGKGCLIIGSSGTGKSTLAIELIAAGAQLVADDRTRITQQDDGLILSAPETIAGRIEVSGVGLLRLTFTEVPLDLIVDLDRSAGSRLPAPRFWHMLGVARPVVLGRNRKGLAAILHQILMHGIQTPC